MPVTYIQLVAGIKKETSLSGTKNKLAAELQLSPDSLKATSTAGQVVINTGKGEAAGKILAANLLKKDAIAYVHPCLVGPSGKLASYGDEFVVKLKTGISSAQLKALVLKHNSGIIKAGRGDRNTYLISAGIANKYDGLKMANIFFESGLFDYAQPDFITYGGLSDAPNDPLYNLQWAHKNTGSADQYNGIPGADLQVDSAWLITMGDSNIKIGVIDTGVDTAQADLKKNLLQGYDCISGTSNPGDGMPRNMQNAHGTSCAGIIASVANNSIGTAGIAPNCKIIPVNISDEGNVFAGEFAIAEGMDYAWQNGADVLTNSWDLSLPSSIIDDAIHRAVTLGRSGKGCIVFFATGNENSGISYPSSNPEVVAVGGTNMFNERKSPTSQDGEYWWGANYGVGLDVVAPCIDLATADISGVNGYNTAAGADGDYYKYFGGTSGACPHAAAVAALVLSVDATFTAAEVRTIIETNCTKAGSYNYALTRGNINGTWNNEMGYGRINAYRSVLAAQNKQFCNVGIKTPPTTTLCKNASVKLELETAAAGTYTWRFNGADMQTGTSVTVTAAGSYDVVAAYINGCNATSAAVIISVADTALKADAGKNISICTGSPGIIIGGEPSAKGGAPFIAGKRAFGYDNLFGSIVRFNLENPREYESIQFTPSATVFDNDFAAGDFTPYGYYMLTKSGNLFSIDTATGVETFIGLLTTENVDNAAHGWSGMAWDPVDKKLYALSTGASITRLYQVNPFDGTSTAGPRVSNTTWIACNSNGTMYGFYSPLRRISKINKITGENTILSNNEIGNSPSYLDGAVDPLDGKIYQTTSAFFNNKLTQDLYVIDTATYKVSVKGHVGALSTVTSLAISGGTYKYKWAPAEGLSQTDVATPVAKPSVTTTYTLTVTDACGQKATSTVQVVPNAPQPPVIITTAVDSICVGETTRLSVTQDSTYTYQWYLNGSSITGATDTFYVAQRMGDFQVKVSTAHNACTNASNIFTVKDCSIWLNSNTADTTCYAYFYPSHGYGNKFEPGENFVKTVYPSVKGNLLTVKFSNFVMKNFNDLLTIYNGADTTAPILLQCRLAVPPSTKNAYISTAGPLTFRFSSTNDATSVGTWEAFLQCITPKTYRSKTSGLFESAGTWEVKTGTGAYGPASTAPTLYDDSIVIQAGHTVTLSQNVNANVDQLWLQPGATLIINGQLTINSGNTFTMVADGNIIMGPFGNIYGAAIHIRGNITGTKAYFGAVCYIDGNSPQTLHFDNALYNSLHIVNANGVTETGWLRTDSLFMNTGGRLTIDSADISYLLSLQNGIIDISGNGNIKSSTALKLQVEGGNNKSYVNGPLSRAISSQGQHTLKYPIGRDGLYKPVTLSINQQLFPYENQYKVQLVNHTPPITALPAGIQNVSNLRYYKIDLLKNNPVSAATITLPYDADDYAADPANLRIVKDSASKWVNIGGQGNHAAPGEITSTSNFTFKFINISSFFALANSVGGTNALPVTWLSFMAAPQNKAILLQWNVTNEINCAYYYAERSIDGLHFNGLAKIPAVGGPAVIRKYAWQDNAPVTGISYYRIKQVDKDGRYAYSKIISVQTGEQKNYIVTPNPAHDIISITATVTIKEIDCYSSTGQLVKKVLPASTQYTLAVKQLAADIYTLRIVTASNVFTTKVVKQ